MFWLRARCNEGVHKFEPRYDIVAPEFIKRVIKVDSCSAFAELYEKHYVYDICVRCGKIAKAPDRIEKTTAQS